MLPPPDHVEPWLDDITQLLDEHHVLALSDNAAVRAELADRLVGRLRTIANSETLVVPGRGIRGAADIRELIPPELIPAEQRSSLDDPIEDFTAVLRERSNTVRRRYLVWTDADVLLEADVNLFGRLANVLCATAAEREYVSDDRMLIQRIVFTGGAKLGAYAEEPQGQFSRWLPDDPLTAAVEPFIQQPPVLALRIDA